MIAISLVIHPRCVIDEYAIIVRKWDWFIPTIPPTMAFIHAKTIIRYFIVGDRINDIIINGANFCHVERIRAATHEIDVITDGYHKWHGAIPIFRIRAINKITAIYEFNIKMFIWNQRDILDISKILDPIAWTRKYFTVASTSWASLDCIKIGINLSRFSSRAAHIKIQFVLEIAIKELMNIIK